MKELALNFRNLADTLDSIGEEGTFFAKFRSAAATVLARGSMGIRCRPSATLGMTTNGTTSR